MLGLIFYTIFFVFAETSPQGDAASGETRTRKAPVKLNLFKNEMQHLTDSRSKCFLSLFNMLYLISY